MERERRQNGSLADGYPRDVFPDTSRRGDKPQQLRHPNLPPPRALLAIGETVILTTPPAYRY